MKPPTAAKKKLNAIIEAEGKSRDGAEDENEGEEGEWGDKERDERGSSPYLMLILNLQIPRLQVIRRQHRLRNGTGPRRRSRWDWTAKHL